MVQTDCSDLSDIISRAEAAVSQTAGKGMTTRADPKNALRPSKSTIWIYSYHFTSSRPPKASTPRWIALKFG